MYYYFSFYLLCSTTDTDGIITGFFESVSCKVHNALFNCMCIQNLSQYRIIKKELNIC